MKTSSKIVIVMLIAALIGCGVWYFNKDKGQLKGTFKDYESNNILGSSSNLVSVPRNAVFANTTTTPPTGEYGMTDSATTTMTNFSVVQQSFFTSGVRKGILNVSAIGPTATSTLYIRQMGSFDESNYFDLATSTNSVVATTSITMVPVRSVQLDPGTATSSVSIAFEIDGYKYTRFIVWSEGWTGDLDTGVQAWIEFVPITDL